MTDPSLARTIETMTARLLDQRNAAGYWEGRLSSSALSTATAVTALSLAENAGQTGQRDLITAGLGWLIANQNADGGWGDTVKSSSNLSTTALCWAALRVQRPASTVVEPSLSVVAVNDAISRAEGWLQSKTGNLTPDRVRSAVIARYGHDRTFSAPILTALTLAGCLGEGREAWRQVPQLPFELAACPHQVFQWLRLPVVSYALPALIAIGQVRHQRAPTRNPIMRGVRALTRGRTLATLEPMQPASGGYFEATPLTAFVVMSLIGAGQVNHPVVRQGVKFLLDSVREDGSWPIDTNLATWVTTLAANALRRETRDERLINWLLDQQHREEHPYTHARPGGWAWTHLAGGVPDADDTAGALVALAHLYCRSSEEAERGAGVPASDRAGVRGSAPVQDAREAAQAGITWLLDLQNRDGGIPTFCRGWGAVPFDRSAPDLTAHAIRAWDAWVPTLAPALGTRVRDATTRAIEYLASSQRDDGSWAPLWFGNEHVDGEVNLTFGTARVIVALDTALARSSSRLDREGPRAIQWLVRAQNPDGGWGGAHGAPSSIEETGLALTALASLLAREQGPVQKEALQRGVHWIIDATDEGRRTPPSPIGLYFARLWYFEQLYPLVFGLAGLTSASRAITDAA